MKRLSLEDSMDFLKSKIVDSYNNGDYDSFVNSIRQYKTLEYYVSVIQPLRKNREW